jgi:hypothetical protein
MRRWRKVMHGARYSAALLNDFPCERGVGAVREPPLPSNTVILSPFAVILSAAKNLALPLRVNTRRISLCLFSTQCEILPSRCSGPPAAPQNDSAGEFLRSR